MSIFDPFGPFAFLPYAFSFLSIFQVRAVAVLLAVDPFSMVHTAIRPSKSADSMFLIVKIIAYVFAAVRPCEDALAFHFVVDPIALKLPTVIPLVDPSSVNIIVLKFSIVGALVAPNELALAVFEAVLVVSDVLRAVRPLFDSFAILLVREPLPLVSAATIVGVDTIPIGLVLVPSAFIDVALCVDQAAVPLRQVVLPETVISGAVWPDLDPSAVSLPGLGVPLALVQRHVLQALQWLDDSLDLVAVTLDPPVEWLQQLDDLRDYSVGVVVLEDLQ